MAIIMNSLQFQKRLIGQNTAYGILGIQQRHFSEKMLASDRMTVITVPQKFEGERLDKFVMSHFKMTWPAAHKLIRMKKAFIVKSKEVQPENKFIYREKAYKLQPGDELCYPKEVKIERDQELRQNKEKKTVKQTEEMSTRLKSMIIFENEHVIVINKDNGVPSQMGTGLSIDNKSQISIDSMLNAYCEEGKLIHRLDRKTSGLMVLAKNLEMAAWLSQLFKERQIYKAYYALLSGLPVFNEATIRQSSADVSQWEIDNKQRILKSPQVIKDASTAGTEAAKLDMVSHYEVLSVSHFDKSLNSWNNVSFDDANKFYRNLPVEKYSYVRFILETGKKHQIRKQCQVALKSPIFGDTKFGFENDQAYSVLKDSLGLTKNMQSQLFENTIFLHSGELQIPVEPGSTKMEKFTGKLKNSMSKVLDQLHVPKVFYL